MAIVFEEVNAEIAPPPAATDVPQPHAAADATDAAGALDPIRHALALLAERRARLHAD